MPGGGAVLFEIRRRATDVTNAGIAVLSLETGNVQIVAEQGTNPLYAETGHVVYARGDTLFAVSFDLWDLRVTGPPVSILQGVRVYRSGAPQFSVSRDGTLAYLPGTGDAGNPARRLVWVDRHGASQPVTDKLRAYRTPRLSPDGERVAVEVGQVHIWILEIQEEILKTSGIT